MGDFGDETPKSLRDARLIARLRAFEAAREGEEERGGA